MTTLTPTEAAQIKEALEYAKKIAHVLKVSGGYPGELPELTDQALSTLETAAGREDRAGGTATSAELFAALGSDNPERDERELNAVIRRMNMRVVDTGRETRGSTPQTIENEARELAEEYCSTRELRWGDKQELATLITQALLKARREAMDSVIEWHVLAAKVKRDLAEKMFNPEKPFQIVHCPEAEIHEQCAAYFRNLKERSSSTAYTATNR